MIEYETGQVPVLAVGAGLMEPCRLAALAQVGIAVESAQTGAMALAAVEKSGHDTVLVALPLSDMTGEALIDALKVRNASSTVVLVFAADCDVGEAALEQAYDYLVEPVDDRRLAVTARNARERARLHTALADLSPDLEPAGYFGFIGRSVAMRSVYRMIESVARSRATVFITGEDGTGKAVCAEAIHKAGPRRSGPFVTVDCATIPADRIETEIFGAADTGAAQPVLFGPRGAIAKADGGTLFLNEICALDNEMQAKILRFLQTAKIEPNGGAAASTVDVRVICATDRDPTAEVAAGRFRADLFYRLHVLPIHLPPLREREGDVLEIAIRTLRDQAARTGKRFRVLAPDARALLAAHEWPGNVRELEEAIFRAVDEHDGEVLTAEMLPVAHAFEIAPTVPARAPEAAPAPLAESEAAPSAVAEPEEGTAEDTESVTVAIGQPLAEMERQFIEATIDSCDGSLPRAARLLGVSPSTLYRKRESWGASE